MEHMVLKKRVRDPSLREDEGKLSPSLRRVEPLVRDSHFEGKHGITESPVRLCPEGQQDPCMTEMREREDFGKAIGKISGEGKESGSWPGGLPIQVDGMSDFREEEEGFRISPELQIRGALYTIASRCSPPLTVRGQKLHLDCGK